MIRRDSRLVILVKLVDRVPMPPSPAQRGRGRPQVSSDRLLLKALVIMIGRHLHRVHAGLSVLHEPTAEMHLMRALLMETGRFPTRRTGERRLKARPDTRPAQSGCLGRGLVTLIDPWATSGRAVAIDSTGLRAKGGVWHKKHREQGVVPHPSIDPEAHWTKSGWHGWVYGWKLHRVTVVAAGWMPGAAELTAANQADNEIAPRLLSELPPEAHFVLGDTAYADPELSQGCAAVGRILITPRRGAYPHADEGVEVRRIFHKLRSLAIENCNDQVTGLFDSHGQVPTTGLSHTRRFALGAIFVYQLALWYRCEHGLDLRVGLNAFLKAA
jgi:hypothetical protein